MVCREPTGGMEVLILVFVVPGQGEIGHFKSRYEYRWKEHGILPMNRSKLDLKRIFVSEKYRAEGMGRQNDWVTGPGHFKSRYEYRWKEHGRLPLNRPELYLKRILVREKCTVGQKVRGGRMIG